MSKEDEAKRRSHTQGIADFPTMEIVEAEPVDEEPAEADAPSAESLGPRPSR